MDKAVCSRCGKGLDDGDEILVSAGLCSSCFNTLLTLQDRGLSNFLESLGGAAALLARDHTVLLSNKQLRSLLANGANEVDGKRIGEVLDCLNAATLGRCGETEACFIA